jgi:hypothetical protein
VAVVQQTEWREKFWKTPTSTGKPEGMTNLRTGEVASEVAKDRPIARSDHWNRSPFGIWMA